MSMEPSTIVATCIYGVMLALVLAIILFALYLMTEGVEGIARRLYAMLLLFLSALVAGVVIGVPVLLVAFAIAGGLFVVAAAAGIPFGVLMVIVAAVGCATPRASSRGGRNSRDSWLRSYQAWIKRVAQGKKRPN
jgi:hypothetical protein